MRLKCSPLTSALDDYFTDAFFSNLLMIRCDNQRCSRFARAFARRPLRSHRVSVQAVAAVRLKYKSSVHDAAESGDFRLVKDHVIVDPACVHRYEWQE